MQVPLPSASTAPSQEPGGEGMGMVWGCVRLPQNRGAIRLVHGHRGKCVRHLPTGFGEVRGLAVATCS